jgi:polysaccharide chain length determinant protein (PEP-CTERM system associated)
MLPGKAFTPEDILAILRRRYWLILVPFAVAAAATTMYTSSLPDRYRSDGLISVVPPKIPANLTPAAVVTNTKLEERIPAIRNEILSRTRLERIILDLDLYRDERRVGILQDIVDRMRNDIYVTPVAGSAIRVGFNGDDPRTVRDVAVRLVALFIDESTRDRKLMIENTDQFLNSSLKEAEATLADQERKYQEYRLRHNGELPENLQANLQAIQNLQQTINGLQQEIDRGAQAKIALERTIADLEHQAENAPPESLGEISTTSQQLTAQRAELLKLLERYTADHPQVKAAQRRVDMLQEKLEDESRNVPLSASGRVLSPSEQARQRGLKEAKDRIQLIDEQTARNQKVIADHRAQIAVYQRRAEAASSRQTEMTSMNRDLPILTNMYSQLRSQKAQTDIAANLERREIGEQFKEIDSPTVPGAPFAPDRERTNMMGMGIGLALGLALVALLEYRDSTFKTDEDLARVLGMPVLAVVPLMQSDVERRRAWRRRLATNTVLGSVVMGCLAVAGYIVLL